MKIDGIEIEDFSQPEYTQEGPVTISNLNGDDLLIEGPNKSGKTLTFNAIVYCVIGETVDRSRTGHGNDVKIRFDDGAVFQRREVERRFTDTSGEEFTAEKAGEVFHEKLGRPNLIRWLFAHSHVDRLPLGVLTRTRLIELVLSVSDSALKKELEESRDAIEELREERQQVVDKIDSLDRQRDRLRKQIYQLNGQVERWETVLSLIQNDRLAEISELLLEKPEIESELNDLTSERHGCRDKISELENELELVEGYEAEFKDIVSDALQEFICPVCDNRVGSDNALDRLSDGLCPFCGQQRNLDDLENYINERKEETAGRSTELRQEISELEDRISEIDSRIEELEDEQEEIAELNETAVNKLDEYDHDIEGIRSEAVEELEETRPILEEHEDRLESLEQDLNNAHDTRDLIEEKKDELESKIARLEDEQAAEKVDEFQNRWNSQYQLVAPDLAYEFQLEEDGQIILPDGEGGDRYYRRRGELSDSEIQALNISFVVTLNEFLRETNTSPWRTLVFDEPLVRFDDKNKGEVLRYLRNVDQQVIITTSDESVREEFGDRCILELERNEYEQAKLSEFR